MRTVYRQKPGAWKVIRAALGLILGLAAAAWFCYVIVTGDAPLNPDPDTYSPKPWEFALPLLLVLVGVAFAVRFLAKAFVQRTVVDNEILTRVTAWGRKSIRCPLTEVKITDEHDHMGERRFRVIAPGGEFTFDESLPGQRELRKQIMEACANPRRSRTP